MRGCWERCLRLQCSVFSSVFSECSTSNEVILNFASLYCKVASLDYGTNKVMDTSYCTVRCRSKVYELRVEDRQNGLRKLCRNVLQWASENCCPWDDRTCTNAGPGGHLEVLQWARASATVFLDSWQIVGICICPFSV